MRIFLYSINTYIKQVDSYSYTLTYCNKLWSISKILTVNTYVEINDLIKSELMSYIVAKIQTLDLL